MLDFRPPKENPALIGLAKLTFPLYLRYALHDTQVELVTGAVERFGTVAGKRGMICPNHSNRHDPQVMFAFSRVVKEDFNFIAAREVFDWSDGWNGWWIQRLGAYSVVRGAADRESFKMTRKIISEGKKKLVLFPEGEISRQNDTLMALESGAAQLCFWAVEELGKANANGDMASQLIWLLPMAIKYTFRTDIRPALAKTLVVLEEKIGLTHPNDKTLVERVRAIAHTLLVALENEYDCRPADADSLNDRITNLRAQILKNAAYHLRVELPVNAKQLDSVRVIRNALDDFIYCDEAPKSEYQKRLHDEKASIIRNLYRDLGRVINFIAIYEGYLGETATQERFADILDRLETEITGGEPSFHGPRRVLIDVGEAIDMSARFADYKKDKRSVLRTTTDEVSNQISAMLHKLESLRTPVMVT